jgi:hypothetical protein
MSFPISLRIIGRYQDIYLYKGNLYLWTTENDLQVISWDALISAVASSTDSLIVNWSFTRNDFLRSSQFKDMLNDSMMRELLSRKLLQADDSDIALEPPYLEKFRTQIIDNHVEDTTDMLFYRDVLYISSASGVYSRHTGNNRGLLDPASLQKIHDAYTVSISAKYRTLNGACCEDGLFCWSTVELKQRAEQVYRSEKFTRATSWLHSDFLTLEDDSFSYHVNQRYNQPPRLSDATQLVESPKKTPVETSNVGENTESLDESSIEKYGIAVFGETDLVKEATARITPRTLFTLANSVFLCGKVDNHHRLIRWKRPARDTRFQDEGFVEGVIYGDIYNDVFSGAAIDSRTVVLDTENGSLICEDKSEPYWLSHGMNVGLRAFSDSRWYVNLVCSIKEDHVLVSCIWPIDPMSVLSTTD